MSWFDYTPEQRERAKLPKFIVRAPKPDLLAPVDLRDLSREGSDLRESIRWEWENGWDLDYDTNLRRIDLQRQGWEVRPIYPGRLIVPSSGYDEDQERQRQRKSQIRAWADAWIANAPLKGCIWQDDREAVLQEVERRLREATADGFLLRALEAQRVAP